jgi:hypothetical protein
MRGRAEDVVPAGGGNPDLERAGKEVLRMGVRSGSRVHGGGGDIDSGACVIDGRGGAMSWAEVRARGSLEVVSRARRRKWRNAARDSWEAEARGRRGRGTRAEPR